MRPQISQQRRQLRVREGTVKARHPGTCLLVGRTNAIDDDADCITWIVLRRHGAKGEINPARWHDRRVAEMAVRAGTGKDRCADLFTGAWFRWFGLVGNLHKKCLSPLLPLR